MALLHIGFSNVVATDKVVAIIAPDTAMAKRLRELSRDKNQLIDCTMGRKLRSMVLTESDYVFLSAMRPEALMQRFEKPGIKTEEQPADEDE